MSEKMNLLIFEIDNLRCGVPLSNVLKVESAVEISPLPNAPEVVAGVVNVQGKLLPVMNIRNRLKKSARNIALSDHLILAYTEKRKMALWVEAVTGVEECEIGVATDLSDVLKSLPHLSGVTALKDELILIHDLEKFLTADEEDKLTQALDAVAS